jgi:hypothetical protein
MQEGSTLKAVRLTQLQACPKNKNKKNSSETFWTDRVLSRSMTHISLTVLPKLHLEEAWGEGKERPMFSISEIM